MKRTLLVLLIALWACAVQAVAQTPRPGAEQKRLSYFAGTWRWETNMKASPLSSAGKYVVTENIQWLPGGFHLVSQGRNTAPQGNRFGGQLTGSQFTSHGVWSYDSDNNVYTHDQYESNGRTHHCTGSVAGDTWTFTCPFKGQNGEALETRWTIKETSRTSATFTGEIVSGPGAGSTIFEGKGTKISGRAARRR
jgi:hypothetical protein